MPLLLNFGMLDLFKNIALNIVEFVLLIISHIKFGGISKKVF